MDDEDYDLYGDLEEFDANEQLKKVKVLLYMSLLK